MVERVIYNSFLSGLSLDGKKFYYSNPQEVNMAVRRRAANDFLPIVERVELFGCSCCPPNVVRFISSIQNLVCAEDDKTVYVNQYISCEAETGHGRLTVESGFPYDGRVKLRWSGDAVKLALRVPGWCTDYAGEKDERGFTCFDVSDGAEITVEFPMKPQFVEADPRVYADCGRAALVRGPLVYCLEGVDNQGCLPDLVIDPETLADGPVILDGVRTVTAAASRRSAADFPSLYRPLGSSRIPTTASFIPYYAIENRGPTDMLIWVRVKE